MNAEEKSISVVGGFQNVLMSFRIQIIMGIVINIKMKKNEWKEGANENV
jgi:hypothetical protein